MWNSLQNSVKMVNIIIINKTKQIELRINLFLSTINVLHWIWTINFNNLYHLFFGLCWTLLTWTNWLVKSTSFFKYSRAVWLATLIIGGQRGSVKSLERIASQKRIACCITGDEMYWTMRYSVKMNNCKKFPFILKPKIKKMSAPLFFFLFPFVLPDNWYDDEEKIQNF